jgi:transcriptional regulator with XRE-family HTH domain
MRGRTTIRSRPPFGANLAETRIESGMSQQELADKLGVHRSLIMYYERRSGSPKLDFVFDCSDALRVPVERLLSFKGRAATKKTGPKSEVDRLFELIRGLSAEKRRSMMKTIAALLKGLAEG